MNHLVALVMGEDQAREFSPDDLRLGARALQGADPMAKDSFGQLPIHVAAYNNGFESALYIIKKGPWRMLEVSSSSRGLAVFIRALSFSKMLVDHLAPVAKTERQCLSKRESLSSLLAPAGARR
jgi:hypothetical protein